MRYRSTKVKSELPLSSRWRSLASSLFPRRKAKTSFRSPIRKPTQSPLTVINVPTTTCSRQIRKSFVCTTQKTTESQFVMLKPRRWPGCRDRRITIHVSRTSFSGLWAQSNCKQDPLQKLMWLCRNAERTGETQDAQFQGLSTPSHYDAISKLRNENHTYRAGVG